MATNLLKPKAHESQSDFLDRVLNSKNAPSQDDALLAFRRETKGVKIIDGDKGQLGGWAIPYGGPIKGGRDLDNEFFAPDTNFCLDWFPDEGRPMLYQHGLDKELKMDKIGTQTAKYVDPELGIWADAQLDMAHKYAEIILDLAKKGVLGYSSGALGGYVRRSAVVKGKIEQWPWIEQTLTPVPANPYALIAPDAVKHFKGIDLSELAQKAFDDPESADAPKNDKKITIPDGMSLNDFRDALEDAIEEKTGNDNVWVVDVRDGKVIAQCGDDYDKYMQFDFKVGADGITVNGDGVEVEEQRTYVPSEGKQLTELAAKLEEDGWTKGAKFSARHMGQLHASIKAQHELHEATCEMNEDCPLDNGEARRKTAAAAASKMTNEEEEQRRELDDYLATIEVTRSRYA